MLTKRRALAGYESSKRFKMFIFTYYTEAVRQYRIKTSRNWQVKNKISPKTCSALSVFSGFWAPNAYRLTRGHKRWRETCYMNKALIRYRWPPSLRTTTRRSGQISKSGRQRRQKTQGSLPFRQRRFPSNIFQLE